MNKRGKIIPNGVVLQTHENAAVVLLTEQGLDVELIPRSNIKGIHTPDFKANGTTWELKSPVGEGKYLIPNTIQKAVKQSSNVVIDLRRTKRHQAKCIRELKREFEKSKSLKRLKVITKNNKILDFKK
ncbi:hypothetical protein J6S39_00065 [Candidatus Saccharibacteria bacterium]|nr:hypothetical protein [Candidatus Saccharibacteria bacterium]